MQRLDGAGYRAGLFLVLTFGCRPCAKRLARHRLQREPDDAHALATLAHLLAVDEQRGEALQLLHRLTRVRPQDASAWYNLGFLLEQTGDLSGAEEAFNHATEHAPGLDQAWYGLGLCLIAQSRPDEALAALRRAADLQPMSPFAWYQMARVHAERGDTQQALPIIDHLQGFEPRVAAQLLRETGIGGQIPHGSTAGALRIVR